MFFAHVALRPALKVKLSPQARIEVAIGVFQHFFPWVWVAVLTLWISGLWIAIVADGNSVGLHVQIMMGIALVMTLIFAYLFAFPYRTMVHIATAYENWALAGTKFAEVRKWMLVNLILGVVTMVVASAGPSVIPAVRALFK
ncbi:MAG TPA: hypothetical protein VES73_07180 [Lamprocystis sp. (in: g-proteobacteria)]|nr:hypothetical protein [Lamprocystis sp. (in: g-proteobacteria)]